MQNDSAYTTVLQAARMGKPVYAVRVVGAMRGKSGALLVAGHNGSRYVVKIAGNPRMPNLLANEYLGSSLAMAVGLPVAKPQTIHLSSTFLQDPYFAVSLQVQNFCPTVGLHYASEVVHLPVSHFLMEYLPRCRAAMVQNREVFLGMYLLDIWAKHMDGRQTVFAQEKNTARIQAFFIDHGDMFGGAQWDFKSKERPPYHPTLSLYSHLWTPKAIKSWVKLFRARLPSALENAIYCMPPWWFTGDIQSLQESLYVRLRNLPDLIHQAFSENGLLKGTLNDKLYIQESRIRQVRVGG